ncbi:[protein-PII] uridylyltransferase [Shewanella sp. 10N.286.52.C2]|uniref:bifunctional uridylyltransferase/uridylyl-removing protein GlnD n=1 Tax=unclassified Shewanella TaxID=196818 RepID=UPI000C815C98|nr:MULTISPECIES: bifunctional uridylyltransferase/uridylyl-removing protein GlnD [unclassified Shewanella]MDO6775836.1 bifunctional uridylyltransferase/uridylyl-removing protein GlnD [Shewanella sp. 3_MG-2023]PMG29809.1 [protein-PII] uridylyltransferase [Shewanella sp. 10N.286.52.C2]PMI03501.1 [protein-PII] uridylyltransferase [Shewanella sp. 10N.286.48.A6]
MNTALVAKNTLVDLNQRLLAQFAQKQPITELVKERCVFVDELLKQAWQSFYTNDQTIALIAVGGYGRGELHPHSDIDLLILTQTEAKNLQAQELISQFITYLWDSGLEIGHSVRTIEQTLELGLSDISTATNLLEARLLSGDESLFDQLYDAIREHDFWPSDTFFLAKKQEQQYRHAKANAFDLEPNIKSCPGGLRDIQTIAWVAMRHFDAASLQELVGYDFLEPIELTELLECQDFLWQLRFSLHMIAGRDENRLLFDLQRQVAAAMGYEDGTQLAVEQMMKRYYRTVRRVMELNEMLLQLFKRATLHQTAPLTIQPINENYQRRGHFIEVLDNQLFEQQPEQIINLFLLVAKNSNIQRIYAPTLRLLRKARRGLKGPLQDNPECRKCLMSILKHPRGITALSLMHKHGILSSYLPAWRNIEGQMQFDLFHAYTVDEHTHRLLLNIDRFSQTEQIDEFPLGAILINQLPKKGLLVLGAIFHDIAKGRGGDHSKLGSKDALDFCKLHGLNDHDGRLVAWLVENHLVMSVTAQRRDISDPDVVAVFADRVQDAVHLSYLYCLTVADICATNHKAWNNWKGSLLRDLYFSTQRVLARGKEKPIDVAERVQETKQKAQKELLRRGVKQKNIDALWLRFKDDYFLRHQPNQVSWHTEALLKHDKQKPLVLISKHTTRGGSELFVYAKDKPKLFATVMAVLDNKNINVHDANVMTSNDDYALDTFVILEQDGEPISQLSRIQSIKKSLEKALAAQKPKPSKFRKLSRIMKPFNVRTQVSFLPGTNHDTSMMELIALDFPGLLASVGEVLHRCDITLLSAKITTIGERAEDFFILQNNAGSELNETQQAQLSEALLGALSTPLPQ